jgi:predicted RNase H-like HicB family nuclease
VIPIDEHSYLVIIERGRDGYGAWAPDLPGCVALGDTPDDAEREMREAIAFHLDGLREDGCPIPPASAAGMALVQVPAA